MHPLKGHRWGTGQKRCLARKRSPFGSCQRPASRAPTMMLGPTPPSHPTRPSQNLETRPRVCGRTIPFLWERAVCPLPLSKICSCKLQLSRRHRHPVPKSEGPSSMWPRLGWGHSGCRGHIGHRGNRGQNRLLLAQPTVHPLTAPLCTMAGPNTRSEYIHEKQGAKEKRQCLCARGCHLCGLSEGGREGGGGVPAPYHTPNVGTEIP